MERPSPGVSPTGPRRPRGSERPWLGIALTLGAASALAIAVLAIEPLREAVGDALRGDTESLREELRGTAAGIGVLYGVIAIHTFVWYPAEIVDTAAGFVYGFWPALVLVMAGWVVQGLAAYWIGRLAARPLLHRFIDRRRFEQAERAIADGGVMLLLAARLVPIVPFSLFSYVAGAARVPVVRFTWTTAVGYIPITALFIYFGSELEELSLTDPIIVVGTLIVVALLLLTRKLSPLFHHQPEGASTVDGDTLDGGLGVGEGGRVDQGLGAPGTGDDQRRLSR
jgi:uncharacterized membrane protein YdjX (TVP38/TMEM64 family)